MQEVRHALETCDDGCPNQHYTKAHGPGSAGVVPPPLLLLHFL